MNALRQAWQVLGIAADSDVAAIRAAYARQLKSFDPDEDPERFAELRAARDAGIDAQSAPDIMQAVGRLTEGPPARVLICGSLYLAGAVLAMAGVDSGDGFLHPSADK